MANKETTVEVTCTNPDGTLATKKLPISSALSLLKMSFERGWGWSVSKDSKYAFNAKDGVLYKKPVPKIKEQNT